MGLGRFGSLVGWKYFPLANLVLLPKKGHATWMVIACHCCIHFNKFPPKLLELIQHCHRSHFFVVETLSSSLFRTTIETVCCLKMGIFTFPIQDTQDLSAPSWWDMDHGHWKNGPTNPSDFQPPCRHRGAWCWWTHPLGPTGSPQHGTILRWPYFRALWSEVHSNRAFLVQGPTTFVRRISILMSSVVP